MADETLRIALAVNVVDPHPNHQAVFAGVLEYAREHANWACFIDEHPLLQARRRRKASGGYDGVIAQSFAADEIKRLSLFHFLSARNP